MAFAQSGPRRDTPVDVRIVHSAISCSFAFVVDMAEDMVNGAVILDTGNRERSRHPWNRERSRQTSGCSSWCSRQRSCVVSLRLQSGKGGGPQRQDTQSFAGPGDGCEVIMNQNSAGRRLCQNADVI